MGDAVAEDFAPFVELRKLRRAEQISKNVLLCAFRALEQAQVQELQATQAHFGIAMLCSLMLPNISLYISVLALI